MPTRLSNTPQQAQRLSEQVHQAANRHKGSPGLPGCRGVQGANQNMSQMHMSAFEGDANIVRGRIELGEDPNSTDEV